MRTKRDVTVLDETIRVLIADDVPETRRNIATLLKFAKGIEVVGEASDGRETVEKARTLRPDCILMDVNMPVMDGIEAAELINTELPGTVVIVISVQGEAEYMRRAMTSGARDYLIKPFSGDELISAIKRSVSVERQHCRSIAVAAGSNGHTQREARTVRKGKVITVFSTKGGVGKTTVATNLASAISRSTSQRVVLLDLDLQFGDVALFLDIEPRRSIADLVSDQAEITAEFISQCLQIHDSGVALLAAPRRPEDAELVTAQNVEVIIRMLRTMADFVIVDTSPNFDDPVLTTLDASDQILLITALDLPTIKNVKLCLDVMRTLKYSEDKISIVLNRADSQTGISPKLLEEKLQLPVDFQIPSDGRLALSAVNTGVPFVLSNPKAPISEAIYRMASSISHDSGPTDTMLPARRRKSAGGIRLSRLFDFRRTALNGSR